MYDLQVLVLSSSQKASRLVGYIDFYGFVFILFVYLSVYGVQVPMGSSVLPQILPKSLLVSTSVLISCTVKSIVGELHYSPV